MSHIHALLTLSVGYHVSFMFHEKHFCFIPCLKDFVLVYKVFHITRSYSSLWKSFSNILYFQTYFLKPLSFYGQLVGRPCLLCLILKIILNMCMKWVVGSMSYTLDLILSSIGIIGFFQLVSLLTFFLYTHMFLYICAYTSNNINFGWYSIFHTYIYKTYI